MRETRSKQIDRGLCQFILYGHVECGNSIRYLDDLSTDILEQRTLYYFHDTAVYQIEQTCHSTTVVIWITLKEYRNLVIKVIIFLNDMMQVCVRLPSNIFETDNIVKISTLYIIVTLVVNGTLGSRKY